MKDAWLDTWPVESTALSHASSDPDVASVIILGLQSHPHYI